MALTNYTNKRKISRVQRQQAPSTTRTASGTDHSSSNNTEHHTFAFPKVLWPASFALPLSLRAADRISEALAVFSSTTTTCFGGRTHKIEKERLQLFR